MRTARTGIAIIVAAVPFVLLLPSAKATTYRNTDFGIEIRLPSGQPTCRGSPEFNHGIRIFLDPRDHQGCPGPERNRRSMEIFAYYNAVDETKYLADYLRWECRVVFRGRCFPAPSGMRFGPYRSISGRVDHRDGWIDIVVVTQGPIRLPDDPTGVVNYGAFLETDRADFSQDLRSFRSFLRNIHLTGPE